ncbi:MAG: DNA repair protein RadA [Candidatus Komeilibacteria bacterium]|nr:DNA repair protein RadA [Candidatus Komeilibacteria bacterium]
MYICSHCDAQYPKWTGRCTECGKWGTIKESAVTQTIASPKASIAAAAPASVTTLDALRTQSLKRIRITGFPAERLFPEGLVAGSLTLLAGEPGAGKSTLCLSLALHASETVSALYFTAEESAVQIKERAERLGSFGKNFSIAETNLLEEIAATIAARKPQIAFVDSLQMVASSAISGEAGSVGMVRALAALLQQVAHSSGCAIIVVGHVTKDGALAGPKSLEHIVDAVYSLEADRRSAYRLLRVYKNRYGASGTVVVMQLGTQGFTEVAHPATIFIKQYEPKVGSALTITAIDDQFFFVEVQALVTKSGFGYAKRTASGFSKSRLELLLAIMKKHLHVDTDAYDVYVNIAGGFRASEPAMDLAVVAALASSIKEQALPDKSVVFGEVGLSGELRVVKETAARLKEIEKNGFSTVFIPPLGGKIAGRMKVHTFERLADLIAFLKW